MPLDVAELEESDYGRYDALVKASPQGSVWSLASFALHRGRPFRVIGVFKGRELVGGGALPVAGQSLERHVHEMPWSGLVTRSLGEGENQAIVRGVVDYCLSRFDESTLSLAPEWVDIREFTWAGFRAHVRYTYRGWGAPFEKRLRIRPVRVNREVVKRNGWDEWRYVVQDTQMTALFDGRFAYYWTVNAGGSYHPEVVNAMITDARQYGRGFDLVGCNSPKRGLFKRAFGGTLCPYYTMTTSDVKDLREAVPIYESAAAVL